MTTELPGAYLDYPRRRYGMDHDRYAWSSLFDRPKVEWPDGARVAVWVVATLDWYPLNTPAKPFAVPGALDRPYPDFRHYSLRDYGSRVGIYRILRVMERHGGKATAMVAGAIAQRYPWLVRDLIGAGWEVGAAGLDMAHVHHGGLDPAQEATWVRETIASVRGASGQSVRGWISPARSESRATLDLITAESVGYVCDWANDDMPYPIKTKTGRLHAMPFAPEIGDFKVLLQYFRPLASYAQQLQDQFDALYAESQDWGGRILCVPLTPWVIGQPHRIRALADTLEAISRRPGVWFATGSEILSAFLAGAASAPSPPGPRAAST